MKDTCFICKQYTDLECHHIYGGVANRKLSEKYNLKVNLCPACHRTGKNAVHKSKETMDKLHRAGQRAFERAYSREEFIKIFGKNYL